MVLLISYDPLVRDSLAAILRRHQFQVLTAGSGNEALEIAGQRLADIRIIITDVHMPGMSGPELVERLLAMRFEGPVLYVSALGDEDVLRTIKPRKGHGFLAKPFTSAELVGTVEWLLGSTKPSAKPVRSVLWR